MRTTINKIWPFIHWALVMLINLLGFLTAPIIYPLLYPFRNTLIRNIKPFWYYFDDEDGDYGTEWFRKAKGLKTGSFWTAYLWSAIRNPAWNLQASLKRKRGNSRLIRAVGRLVRDGELVSLRNMAVLKYVDKEGKYMDNKGSYISLKHSILGRSYYVWEVEGTTYWRYSYAGNVFGKIWIELHMGIKDVRYTFRCKIKKSEIWRDV